jgi:hypothetical protein
MHALDAFMNHGVGTELVVKPQMGAFGGVMIIEGAEHRTEEIRIDQAPAAGGIECMVADRDPLLDRDLAFEEAGLMPAFEAADRSIRKGCRFKPLGARHESAGDPFATQLVKTENPERVAMTPGDDGLHFGNARRPALGHISTNPTASGRSRCRVRIRG